MASQYCVGCGAPLAAGAQNCSYCGRPVAASPAGGGVPLASGVPAGPPGIPPPGAVAPAVAPQRPRRRWGRVVLVIILVVVLLIAGLAVYGYYTTVEVTQLVIYAPDDVCGLDVYLIAYAGFNATTGTSVPLELYVPNNNSSACTLRGVATNTSGFGVEGVQLPGAIAGNMSGVLSNGTLNLTLTVPASRYSGVVNLIFS